MEKYAGIVIVWFGVCLFSFSRSVFIVFHGMAEMAHIALQIYDVIWMSSRQYMCRMFDVLFSLI